MGFGSGGGGFTPSPNNVPGSTETGTSLTDTHEFTGSVDITGSLTLNGSSITGGGGGGAVSTYTNSGNDRVITSVNSNTINGEANLTFDGTSLTSPQVTASVSMKAATLEISSSAEGALFRVDHSTQAGSKPIIFVTGSGIVAIGTDSPRTDSGDTNRLHILGESGADQGQNPAVNSVLVLENNDHAGLNIITPVDKSGMLIFGDAGSANRAYFRYEHGVAGQGATDRFAFDGTFGQSVMTIRRDGDAVNMGKNNSAHMTSNSASLHISSSTGGTDVGGPVLLRVDHADQPGSKPTLFVTGSGRVGIGTASPVAPLGVVGDVNISEGILTLSGTTDDTYLKVQGNADVGIRLVADRDNSGENDNPYIDFYQDGASGDARTGRNGSLGLVGEAGQIFTDSLINAFFIEANFSTGLNSAFQIATRRSSDNQRKARLTIDATNANTGINTNAPQETLSISGSVALSGAFGNRSIETLTANGAISATTGLTIIDASSSLAVNNSLTMTIADGTFIGQEKKIRGMIISGSTGGATSTAINIGGANIDSPPASPAGQITLTASIPGSGPLFSRAGCTLVWGGTKWLPVGNFNFNINNTGRLF
jgi:hypothetical protein